MDLRQRPRTAHAGRTVRRAGPGRPGPRPSRPGRPLPHLDSIRFYEQQDTLVLDPVTVRNLELVSALFAEEAPRGSQPGPATLLAAIDATVTSMGARLLRAWVLRPEIDREEIGDRLDAVAELKSHTILREEIRQNLRGVQDLERLASPATLGVAAPRDFGALGQ